jgi:heat shock protein HslJ
MLRAMVDGLEGRTWVLDPASLGVPGGEQFTPTATLRDGTITGLSGCNRYSGSYTVDDNRLALGPIRTTLRSCGPVADAVEADFLDRLQRVGAFGVDGECLVLVGDDDTELLVFDAMRATLEGSWEIIGYLMVSGAGFSSTVVDSTPTAVFTADGSVSGTTGCNTFRGRYTTDEFNVTIGPLLATRMECPPDRAEQEAGILKALEAATTFALTPGTATLLNASGQLVISLAPAATASRAL